MNSLLILLMQQSPRVRHHRHPAHHRHRLLTSMATITTSARIFTFFTIFFFICSAFNIATIYADSGGTNSGEEKVTVKGVAGATAALPCYIDEANCGDIYFLTWSKLERDDRWSRIYVYSDDNVNKPLSSLAGRARFSMQQKTRAQLEISALKPSDESLYKCDVTYVAGKCPSLTYVQLQIIAKPTRSWIDHEGDLVQAGKRLSLTEGDLLKLSCSVAGGKPAPTIVWRTIDSRGRAITLKRSTISAESNSLPGMHSETTTTISDADGTATTALVLSKKLTREDLGTSIECHVEHEAIKNGSLDSRVELEVSVGIKTMEIIGPSTSVREGDVAVIECVAYGSKPAAEILWRNGSKIIDGRSTSTVEERNHDGVTVNTRSKLEIVVSHQDHLNPITCEAANVAMRAPINKSTEISVLFAPIVVMEPHNGLTVNESTPMVSIYCTYHANPNTLLENETVWFKDGNVLATADRTRYNAHHSADYPVLTILRVSRNDTGSYYCAMANQLGAGVPANTVRLNVLYPAIVSLSVHPSPTGNDYLIKEGDSLRMICDIVDGNPANASRMRWLKNNGETVSELDSETSVQKELTWMSITRSLTGNYTCQAISDAGASDPSNEVAIVVNYPPGKSIIRLLNREAYPVKGENVTLECIVNDAGRPSERTEYHWENSDGVIFESRKSILSIPNLRLVNRGNISCSAVNEVGFGARGSFELIPFAPPRFIHPLPATIGINENFRSIASSFADRSKPATATGDSYRYDYVPESAAANLPQSDTDSSDTISVFCRVECFPLCRINWLRNDQPIDNTTGEFVIVESTQPEEFLLNRFPSVTSTLTWNVSALSELNRVRDSGIIYSCVSTANMVGPSVRSDTTFQVEYPPENLRVSSTRVDVIENEMLPELRCDSDALPPATYRWISNSFYDKFTGVIADTSLLALNRTLQRDSAGTYTCIATNRHGERRVDLQVNVLYKPSCSIYESRTGKDNQDVVVICEVTFANPNTGLEYTWSLNGTQLNETIVRQLSVHEGMKSKIIIPGGVGADSSELFGSWSCSVRNNVGQSDPNCTLFVDAPLIVPEWSPLSDESIVIISAVIVAIIFAFVLILLFLIFMMRRRRHKNDLISTKSQGSIKKATDTERLSSSNSPALGTSPSGEMYENMTFHRKPFGKDMDDVLYADIYEDVRSGKIADPRIKPPLPPKPGGASKSAAATKKQQQQPPKRPPPKRSSKHKSA